MDPFEVHSLKRAITASTNMLEELQGALKRLNKEVESEKALLEKWLKSEYVLRNKDIRDKKQQAHLKLVTTKGSKITKLIEWLHETMKKDKDNRFIVFSKVLRLANLSTDH